MASPSSYGIEAADQLQKLIDKAKGWPVWSVSGTAHNLRSGMGQQVGQFGKSSKDIELWVAMSEGDRDRIKALIDWPNDREYRIDPLPDRIKTAFSDLLYGEDPEITPAKDGDDTNMEELDEANNFADEFRRAAGDNSAEGERYWRIYTDPDQAERPLLEFNSRLDVIPFWRGKRLLAAAFVSLIGSNEIKVNNETSMQFFRHVEIQAQGYVRHLLYRGNLGALGESISLTSLDDTKNFPEEIRHDLPFALAGRIPNKLGRDFRLGISDYQGIKDLLLDLNEARSIMAENARNTAKSKMVVPLAAMKDGRWDAGQDVIVHEALDVGMEEGRIPGPYTVLEYNFDATALLTHIDALRSGALTGVGLMEQFIGTGSGNMSGGTGAESGTSLRTRLIPTTLAAKGRGRFWDKATPEILRRMQLVDALPTAKFGFDHKWASGDEAPVIARKSVLPEDEQEKVTRHVAAVGGEIESIETAVKDLHPDWDKDAVAAELKKIKDDRAAMAPEPPAFDAEGNPVDPQLPLFSNDPADLPNGPNPAPVPKVPAAKKPAAKKPPAKKPPAGGGAK